MEWPWSDDRCIVCLRRGSLTRAHVFPEFLGGFVWSRTHCASCNSRIGAEIESAAKQDDSFRIAIEALSTVLPDLARRFRERQKVIAETDEGDVVEGYVKEGDVRIRTRLDDAVGVLTRSREEGRDDLERELTRTGVDQRDIESALEAFDAAPEDDWFSIGGVEFRHGTVETWKLPFDGKPISDAFPASIAYHFLGLRLGGAIYHTVFDRLRPALRHEAPPAWIVEALRGGVGYEAWHLVGLDQVSPHLVVRVQMFGDLVWRVHIPWLHSSRVLTRDAIGLELTKGQAVRLQPRQAKDSIPLPARPTP